MSTRAKAGGSNEDFEKVKEARNDATPLDGTYFARCVALGIMGDIEEAYKNQAPSKKNKIVLGFEFPEATYIDFEENKVPIMAFKEFTNSMGDKANLYKFLSSWSNGATNKYKGTGDFDLMKMVGKPCLLAVERKQPEGKGAYLIIKTVSGLPKAMPEIKQMTEDVVFDIEENFDKDAFLFFPPYIQDKIADSDQFKALGLDINTIRERGEDSDGASEDPSEQGTAATDESNW